MTEERWRPVVGFEGSYEVSDQGRVRSLDRLNSLGVMRKGVIMRPGTLHRGHRSVSLSSGGKSHFRTVHQLVLESFVGPRPDGYEACHENDEPADNRLENLRWDTRAANTLDRVRNGKHHLSIRTHCKNGHEFDEANTYLRKDGGGRGCRTCEREKTRRLRLQRKQTKEEN